jgi:hypothetical protein
MRFPALYLLILAATFSFSQSCSTGDPIGPPPNSELLRITITRAFPDDPKIEAAKIIVTRTEDGTIGMPGRNIVITAGSGQVGGVTDGGDGTYEATWTGDSVGEVSVTAKDNDSDPVLESGVTFLALPYLETAWDIPIKLESPISTEGWDTAPFLYPSGNRLAFAYITLDMAMLPNGITRPVGQERPGQTYPQTLNIYLGEKPSGDAWWTDWTVENAQCNHFQTLPTYLSAPSVTSNGAYGFCTIQEYTGSGYSPTVICTVDPDFVIAPEPLGSPVDISGFGEDNPYYDISHGWLYFDVYDLSDPLSKQYIMASRNLGGVIFDTPVSVLNLNTDNVETQAFVYEPSGTIYFASDRDQEEYALAIWKTPIYGDQASGNPEMVMKGTVAVGRPSISYDGEWLCFAYAREESGGVNTDIAMCRRVE